MTMITCIKYLNFLCSCYRCTNHLLAVIKPKRIFCFEHKPILCVCTCHLVHKTINYIVLRLPWDSDDGGGTGINCFMDVWNDVSQ